MLFRTKLGQFTKGSKNQRRSNHPSTIVPRRVSRRYALMALIVSLVIVACTNTFTSYAPSVTESPIEGTVLKLWWDKGFTLEEDEALQQIVSNWERQSGNKINLSFYTTDELQRKAQRAVQAGNPPDILMSHSAERELNPRLAWEGKLADVSDVIEPIKSLYPETVLEDIYFYNKFDKKLSYYAVPIHLGITHISYWRDLIELAGRSYKDIPKDWDAFWEFWKQVHDILRTQHNQEIYGLGFPFSTRAGDTYQTFEQILEAYDVQIIDSKGQLHVDDPKVRQGIIDSLDWYTKFYQQGYVPPDAVNWLNPENNRALLNRHVVMTPNFSLSIPAAVHQDPDIYRNKLGTIMFPNKPNGKPMRHLVALRQAVVFAESKNQKLAKDFLAYLIQPKVTSDYLKAAGGRNLPVLKPLWKDPFWTDPTDPHISTAAKILIEGQTRLIYTAQNPAYSIVLEENIWGKVLKRIVIDGISPEQGADEAIRRIKQIFEQWQ